MAFKQVWRHAEVRQERQTPLNLYTRGVRHRPRSCAPWPLGVHSHPHW